MKTAAHASFALVLTLIAFAPAAVIAAGADTPASRGKELFVRNCAPCHGSDRGDFGRAMLPGTDALRIKYQGKVPALLEQRTDLTPVLVRTFVRKGTFSMPPFRKTELTDAQIDEISGYLASTAQSSKGTGTSK